MTLPTPTKRSSHIVAVPVADPKADHTAMTDSVHQILLCPGQGAQHVGMGRSWFERSPAARAIFETADDTLGYPLSQICFEGPAEKLDRTDIAQGAIYTTSIACFAGLREQGQVGQPVATAGLSLGEFTALHLAGAFDFVSGLRLVRRRGEAMQKAAEATVGRGSMVALVGASDQEAVALCQRTLEIAAAGPQQPAVLVPANYNCPGQVVISGNQFTCQLALAEAEKMGLRATGLKVAGAFHSPLMAAAADELAQALEQVHWSKPRLTVVSNVTAQPHTDDIRSIKKGLVEQLTQPVQWTGSMHWLVRNVQGRYVELAPGKVLSGLMRRIDRTHRVMNYSEPV